MKYKTVRVLIIHIPLAVLLCLPFTLSTQGKPNLRLPPRPTNAPTGTQFKDNITSLPLPERERIIFSAITHGNIPECQRHLQPITIRETMNNTTQTITFFVTPDYLSIGTNSDYFRIPTTPLLAQKIADATSTTLPTRKMVDAIWAAATVKLSPQPIPPSPQMITVPVFWTHQLMVQSQLTTAAKPIDALTAGHKKDIVITPQLHGPARPNRVAIYGWHYPNGRPIQPLYLGHKSTYADYSHGVRLVSRKALLNGKPVDLINCLIDPATAPLLNDELTSFSTAAPPRYPLSHRLP